MKAVPQRMWRCLVLAGVTVSWCASPMAQADIVEKQFARSSDGKVASGQVFQPSRSFSSTRKRSRSSRKLPTVSNVILPSLVPSATPVSQPQQPAPVSATSAPAVQASSQTTSSLPRFGFGAPPLASQQPILQQPQPQAQTSTVPQNSPNVPTITAPPQSQQPIYIFSPRYNATQYIPNVGYYPGFYSPVFHPFSYRFGHGLGYRSHYSYYRPFGGYGYSRGLLRGNYTYSGNRSFFSVNFGL